MSSTLNATTRVYTQAVRNVNDGISFLNVADGACSALEEHPLPYARAFNPVLERDVQ